MKRGDPRDAAALRFDPHVAHRFAAGHFHVNKRRIVQYRKQQAATLRRGQHQRAALIAAPRGKQQRHARKVLPQRGGRLGIFRKHHVEPDFPNVTTLHDVDDSGLAQRGGVAEAAHHPGSPLQKCNPLISHAPVMSAPGRPVNPTPHSVRHPCIYFAEKISAN